MKDVYVVVPDGVDDPTRPSGGNVYDRRLCQELSALSWWVHVRAVPGAWPRPDLTARSALTLEVSSIPDGEPLVVDGLIASCAPDVLVPHADRLRLVVLVHMPFGAAAPDSDRSAVQASERAVLAAAATVVTPSDWTREWLLEAYGLDPAAVVVAEPGVDAADVAPGSGGGGELLCVAAVAAHKGHDALLAALGEVADLPWRCVCVGALDVEPAHVAGLGRQARLAGIADRVTFTGPRTGDDLAKEYASADLLVLASTAEAYGMVVTEALARGLPVLASRVGGLPQALGRTAAGDLPGLLVPPQDPAALATALRGWLVDADLRSRLRTAARDRRAALPTWPRTAESVASVLGRLAP